MKSTQTNPTTSVRFDKTTRMRLKETTDKYPLINANQIITAALNEYLDKAAATNVLAFAPTTPPPTHAQDKAELCTAHEKANVLSKKKAKR